MPSISVGNFSTNGLGVFVSLKTDGEVDNEEEEEEERERERGRERKKEREEERGERGKRECKGTSHQRVWR